MAKSAQILTRRRLAKRYLVAGLCIVMVALLAGFAMLIRRNDSAARGALAARYETRAVLSASFAQSYVNDLAARERSQAERLLASPHVDQPTFENVVKSFDFEAGVLVDQHGRVLQVWPPDSNAISSDMAAEYASLRTAAAGHGGVTVSSGTSGERVTAVAVPYQTDTGTRVFSGAFSPAATPLGAFLNSGILSSGGTAYLVERSGNILATSGGATRTQSELARLPLGTSAWAAQTGSETAAVADVPDLPWRVVLVARSAALYAPVTGGHWAPWALWLALAASEMLAVVLFVRLGRARTAAASTARTDALTGLPNRRAMQELLNRAAATSARHGTPLAALMIDIDSFKAINDEHGHDVGDIVIQATATALEEATREADVAGRWGGEEFLILLHHADDASVRVIAERVRMTIATAKVPGRPNIGVTASVGLALLRDGDTAQMVREADGALYVAKANGRNRVEAATVSAGTTGAGARAAHLYHARVSEPAPEPASEPASEPRADRDVFRAPYGTRDVLAPESDRWQELVACFADRARRFGYGLVLTPIFEHAEVFHRVGESTDVVSKEMYEFEDRGGRRLALRPEGTASVVRAFVQNHPPVPWKCWYLAPNFRAERPQKGRYRQHYQVGAEVLGVDDPDVDVEVIALVWGFLRDLGLSQTRLLLNSMGDADSRARHRVVLLEYLRGHADLLGDEMARAEANPLRILDSKRTDWQRLLEAAPQLGDYLSDETAEHFARVQAGLRALDIPFELSPRLVRGFDYYTRTTFELQSDTIDAAQNALGGGGRYDRLAEEMGGPPTPSIGFGAGIERILLACDAEAALPPRAARVEAFVIDLLPDTSDATVLLNELRERGLAADRAYGGRAGKKQWSAADKSGASFGVMLAPREHAVGNVAVKDLRSGEQVDVERTKVADWLLERSGAGARSSDEKAAHPETSRGSTRQ